MLRIKIIHSIEEVRFTVCGALMEPWVSNLKEAWNQTKAEFGDRRIVINLNETTNIDRSGVDLIRALCAGRATFICSDARVAHSGRAGNKATC